ncbi:MAG: glycosyltransferase [Candidatus Gastranaerophilaceae bacterium]|nr:glycosyltransferase [Candidatus Gastranaerophilaceae bacterium]
MLKTPLVSFIVTSYNYGKFVEQTLQSIKEQTYKHFEIIVVDDCSEDNSTEIIERFIQNNQNMRITLIKHGKNLGQFASMIDGLKIAQGVFVSFVDSDDILMPEYAAVHVKTHLETSVAFTSCQLLEIDENNEMHTAYSNSSPQNNDEIKTLSELASAENIRYKKVKRKCFGGWYWAPNSSAMHRKSALEIILNYQNAGEWRVCPDKFLFNLMHLIGGSINISMPLVAYRRHKNNAGGSDYVTGDKKYNNDETTKRNISNNIKIRPKTLKFLLDNRREFISKFGMRGYVKFVLKVLLF